MLQAEGARPAKEQRRRGLGVPGNGKNVSGTNSPRTRLQTSLDGGPVGHGKEGWLCLKGQEKLVNSSLVGNTEAD